MTAPSRKRRAFLLSGKTVVILSTMPGLNSSASFGRTAKASSTRRQRWASTTSQNYWGPSRRGRHSRAAACRFRIWIRSAVGVHRFSPRRLRSDQLAQVHMLGGGSFGGISITSDQNYPSFQRLRRALCFPLSPPILIRYRLEKPKDRGQPSAAGLLSGAAGGQASAAGGAVDSAPAEKALTAFQAWLRQSGRQEPIRSQTVVRL
jgi:hypothetical protein